MREVVVVVVVAAVVVVTFFSKTLAIEERGQLTAAAPTAWQADKQPGLLHFVRRRAHRRKIAVRRTSPTLFVRL